MKKKIFLHRSHNFFWGMMFLVIGILLLMNNFELLPVDLWHYWPVVIIIFGFKLLLQAYMTPPDDSTHNDECHHANKQ